MGRNTGGRAVLVLEGMALGGLCISLYCWLLVGSALLG